MDAPFLSRVVERGYSLAVLEDGSFALGGIEAVEAPGGGAGLSRFLVQFFGPDGTPRAEPVVVLESDQGPYGGVGSLGDHYFVTWQSFDAQETMAALYDEEGTRLGGAFPWPNSEIFFYHDKYRYGPGPDWRILPVVYHQFGFTPLDNPFFQPALQVYGSDARSLGPPFELVPPTQEVELEDVAINGHGRFVVFSGHCPRNPLSKIPCVRGIQIFDGSGQPRSPFLTKDTVQMGGDGGKVNSGFVLGINQDGQFLVNWIEDTFGKTQHLVARLYSPEGSPLSSLLPVAAAPGPSGFGLDRVRPLADGNFVLSWVVNSPTEPLSSLFLWELVRSTRKVVPKVFVAGRLTDDYLLEVNSSGHGVVAWRTLVGTDVEGRLALLTVDLASAGKARPR